MKMNMTIGTTLRVVLPVLLGVALANAASADERSVRRGLGVFKDKAQCEFCHGWDGSGQTSEYGGVAPSLRATELSRDQIAEVVRCGRPGTNMPYHDRRAYTDDRCYGMTAADLGDQMPPLPIETLSERSINDVADYVAEMLKGKGDATYDECLEYWGPGRFCERYR
jgi:mono/diheme cytochrome c family protein